MEVHFYLRHLVGEYESITLTSDTRKWTIIIFIHRQICCKRIKQTESPLSCVRNKCNRRIYNQPHGTNQNGLPQF